MKKKIYVVVNVDDELNPSFVMQNPDFPSAKIKNMTLVVSTHKTIIRVAKLIGIETSLTPKHKWDLVQENFPFGELFNENTHIFDGCVYQNNFGEHYFFMAALPKSISYAIADAAVEKWGSIHKISRLETIEHILFAHYVARIQKTMDEDSKKTRTARSMFLRQTSQNHMRWSSDDQNQWIVYPQDTGFRTLCIKNGVPHSAYYTSNHEDLRESELDRLCEIASPSSVVLLRHASHDVNYLWMEDYLANRRNVNFVIEDMPIFEKVLQVML